MLINIATKELINEPAFRGLYPSISLPARLTDGVLSGYGYATYTYTNAPDYDPETQQLTEQPGFVDGKWRQVWTVSDIEFTPEELAERLTQKKAVKLAEIRAAFIAAEADGYVESSLGFRADATRRSIEDIDGLIDLVSSGALPAPVTFRDYDNAYHQLTLDQLNTLRLEAKGRGPVLYARKWELEAAVDAAETVEAVQAIDVSTGWPGV